jgi:hypothetical protein
LVFFFSRFHPSPVLPKCLLFFLTAGDDDEGEGGGRSKVLLVCKPSSPVFFSSGGGSLLPPLLLLLLIIIRERQSSRILCGISTTISPKERRTKYISTKEKNDRYYVFWKRRSRDESEKEEGW